MIEKRKILIILFLFISIFLVLSIFIHFSHEKEKENVYKFARASNKVYWSQLEEAIKERNESKCENFEGHEYSTFIYRDVCYHELAKLNKNKSLCNAIDSDFIKFDCYLEFELEKNFSFCENNTLWDKPTCYFYIGKKSSKETCDNLEDQANKDKCYLGVAKRSGNYSLCQFIEGNDLNNCIFAVATTSGDLSLCFKMNSLKKMRRCLFGIEYTNIPFSLCGYLENKENCLELFSNLVDKEIYSER